MVIYVDIDNTIFDTPDSLDYASSKPIQKNIDAINDLYDLGHTIVYWTARGSSSGVDYEDLTLRQLKKYGVKYHEARLGKPAYDLFIDDKNINAYTFFESFNKEDYNEL